MSIIEPEAAIWFTLCWIIVVTRLISRRIHLRAWKALQLDDYLIIVAMATDTVLTAIMHILVHTNSNLIPPGVDVNTMSEQEKAGRVYGSKLVLVAEQMQMITVWLIKTCILIMYNRMTSLLSLNIAVKVVGIYVALTFVLMEGFYLGLWCRPFSGYWAVPTSTQCSAATHHLITNAVFNISSDLAIIALPMPLIFKVRLSLEKKVMLICVFLIGTFTIIAAALNKYYSFEHPFGDEWTIWYLRESYTAILCANLPLLWAVLQRVFKLGNWSQRSSRPYGTQSRPYGFFSSARTKMGRTRLESETARTGRGGMNVLHPTESEQQIHQNANTGPIRIYTEREVIIQTSARDDLSAEDLEMKDLGDQHSRSSVDTRRSAESGSNKDGLVTTCQAV